MMLRALLSPGNKPWSSDRKKSPLRDAANFIRTLADSEHDMPECRLSIQMLIDAAEDRGPMLLAKMGIQCAF
jgi:hypothetical protein